MATALQQQLAAIASQSTNQLDLRAQRNQHSKSLLFEPKDAANQTFDTIYQICIEGFQDLCMLDARFMPFAKNLFSEQSKREDRTQMTAKDNEELDNVIRSFLGLISGRLLLKPGHKAIEWLVRRFRVHEYNVDYLILAFLPYHGNPIFATMLSILPKQLSPAFKFLQPYISSLSSPPRHAVLYNAINNPSFFSLLNQFTLSTAKKGNQSANLLGFWASLVAQAINGQLDVAQSGRSDVKRQREEDLLLRVIPVLQEALGIRNAPELYLGSCMVITILVTKTQLEDKVLDSLMDAVIQSWSTATINDGLTCLAVIAEERLSHRLTRTTAKALFKVPQISERLAELSSRYHVGRLFSAVALHALDDMSRQPSSSHASIVQDFLETEFVTAERKRIVVRAMFRLAHDQENLRTGTSKILASVLESHGMQSALESALTQEKLKLEDVEAMLQISLRFQQAAIEAPPETEDVEMTEGEQPDYAAQATSALGSLPQSQIPGETFFTPEDELLESSFGQAFALLTRAKMDNSVLLLHPGLKSDNGLAILSLMARLWCSKRPVSVRQAALQTSKQFIIDNLKAKAPLDLQALVPYVLCALADLSGHIRRSASEVLLEIVSLYRSADGKGKAGSGANIWAQDTIYGSSSKQVTFMASQDAYKLLSTAIVPHLEECILDPAQITNVVTSAIDGTDEDLDLKTAIRTSAFSFLASSAVTTNALFTRYQLLSMMSKCGKAGSQGRTHILIPAIRTWLAQSKEVRSAACSDAGFSLSDIDQVYINSLTLRHTDELECIKSIANADVTNDADAVRLSIHRIKRVWPSLTSEAYKVLAPFLLDNILETGDDALSEVRQAESLDVLRQVDLPTEVLALFLESVPDMAAMTDKPPAAKRRRTSRNEGTPGQLLSTVDLPKIIRRLTIVLELVEGSKPEKHPELLRGMFHVLSELQHYRTQLGSDLVYLQQMTIGSLLSIVDSLKATPGAKVDRSVLRADLIVECVRSTQSTQVHNAALLLISSLASWVPDLVLHSVMPIFTFMSTTVLRQSDDYSAHITDQTVSRVVPPLVASLRKKNQDLITGAAELLLSFTAAFEHVPIDRRLRIFSHLVTALGPDDSLAAVLAMLFEKYPTDRRVAPFCAELASQFSPVTQLKAATQYIELVADALQPKRSTSEVIFGTGDKSAEQVEQSVAHLLASLARLLQDFHLHEQISKTLKQPDTAAIEQVAASLLARSLGFAKSVEGKAEIHRSSGAVVTATLSLLPTPHFVRSALPLLERPDDNVGLRVLQSFENRSDSAKPSDKDSRNALLDALPRICQVVETSTDVALKHSAITCIDRISEKYGKKRPEAVLSAVKIIASDAALGHENNSLRIISLLCLASAVDVLKDEMVGIIPSVMDKAIEYLSDAVEDEPNPRLHDAVFSFMTALLEHLPWVMPAKIFARLLQLACSAAAEPELDKRNKSVRDQFASLAASKIDVKVLVTSIEETFEDAVEDGYYGCSELLSVLEKVINSQPKSALLKSSSAVFAPLQKAFDVRRMLALAEENATQQELALLDSKRDSIMLDTIMKLNDTTFRPFFVRLVEWATESLPASDSEGCTQRSISLYAFLAVFFERLKSIVTSYAGYILSHSASVLETTPVASDADKALLSTVLQTLSSSFKHDQDDFWQAPSHFSTISSALLSLLLRAKHPAVRDALDLIPTIVELATVAASQDHHKELNGALLKNMRSDDALVRLAAVKTEQSLTERLGEDWLGLLPEMLPFISELQEDDDEDVERETLVWIRQIEGVLGESLEGMLQ